MTILDVIYWVRLLRVVAEEVVCVVAMVALAQCFIRSGYWRRTIWRMGLACLLVVMVSELTGFGRGLALWVRPAPPAIHATSWKMPVEVAASTSGELNPVVAMYSAFAAGAFERKPDKAMAVKTLWIPGWVWLAGFVLVMGRMGVARVFIAVLRWRRVEIRGTDLNVRVGVILKQMRARDGVRLWVAPGLVCPVAFGILRPTIVLPEGFAERFTPAQQGAMLTHELAHLVARDPLWYCVADLASALLWWHPAVWWARRQLHNSSELAADEATAILPDGPATLAECLVRLGRELSGLRNWGWMGVGGSGFRSSLGRRVERLIKLDGTSRPTSGGWKIVFWKATCGLFLAGIIIVGAGWMQSEGQGRAGTWNSTLRQSWNDSPASVVLLAALASKTAVTPSVRESKVNEPTEPKPEGHSPVTSSDLVTDEKINRVTFDNTSLGEVLYTVMRQSKSSSCSNRVLVCDSVELEKYTINFSVQHVSICDQTLLDWIVKGSKAPIEYTIYPDMVVFSAKEPVSQTESKSVFNNDRVNRLQVLTTLREQSVKNFVEREDGGLKASSAIPASNLFSRTFKFDPAKFLAAVNDAGVNAPASPTRTNMMVKNFLIKAGMNLDDPRKQVFFNDRNGILLVRATSNELDLIESLLINIKSNPSQSSLTADKGSEVKFLGLTLVDPTVKLMKQYGLPKDSRLPLIIEVNDPSFFPEGMKPSKGCAFWIVENPANGFLFLNEKTPDYRPKNIKELAEAIVACTVSPEEYQKIYDRMAVAARASVSNFKDNPKEQERILKIAESKVPAEEVGKYICRVVYNYPNNAGTMTTWIRMTRADLDQVRELAKK